MLRIISLLLLITSICSIRQVERLSTYDSTSSLAAGDYILSWSGNHRVSINKDFTYTKFVFDNTTKSYIQIMKFSLFSLNGAGGSTPAELYSDTLSSLYVNKSGVFVASATGRTYDISTALKTKYNLKIISFVTVILDEDPNLIFHFGDDTNKQYFPQFSPIQVLGQQFIYGYVPNS